MPLLSKLNIYDFGRQLITTNDLDPVYCMLYDAQLDQDDLERWLIAYWGFYHVGTASWIADQPKLYWQRMMIAAGSKEYPRSSERRHYRAANAIKSVTFLQSKGREWLFAPLKRNQTSKELMAHVQKWEGFGPWIAFKVADMIDSLGIAQIEFDTETAIYKGSPTEGAIQLFETEVRHKPVNTQEAIDYSVNAVLDKLGGYLAPPSLQRRVGLQEVETILCKHKSYLGGHYELGEDVRGLRPALLRFARCSLAQKLLKHVPTVKENGSTHA